MSRYLTSDELTNAWGQQAMLSLFDDRNTRVINADAVSLVIERASAMVDAWMPDTYKGSAPFIAPFPGMIRELAFAYAHFLAFPRNPDYFKAIGLAEKDLYDRAESLGQQLQNAIKRFAGDTAPTPSNVGGDQFEGSSPRGFVFNGPCGLWDY